MIAERSGFRFTSSLLLLIFCLPALSQETMFTVDGVPATTDEFEYIYRKNSHNNPDAFTRQDLKDYLDLYINFKLKVAEAISRGLDGDSALIKEFEGYKVQLKKPYLTDNRINDKLVKEAYERLQTEVRASHILIRVDPDASPEDTLKAYDRIMEIRGQVTNDNFAELAARYSEDPGGRANGGDLGYFTSMQMVYPFEDAAFRLNAGAVSQPVRTQFGYHLIKVNAKRPSQGKVQVAHIMIRFKRNMTKADSLAARQKIFDISEQLGQGFEFEELCRLYSEDQGTRNKGGMLQPFRTGNYPASFTEAAMSLENPGDISDPVTTPFGWHILKLLDKPGIEPLEEVEGTIKSRINSDSRSEIKKRALIDKLIMENEIELNQPVINNTANAQASPQDILLTIQGERYSVQDYLNSSEGAKNDLQAFIDRVIIEDEESRLDEKYPEYGFLVKEYWEGILLFQIMDQEVWKKAVNDSVGLNHFFAKNRKQYQWKERIRGVLYSSQFPELIDSLRLVAKQMGTDFNPEAEGGLGARFSTKEGLFEKDSGQLPSGIEWKTGIQEVEDKSIHYLLVAKEIVPPGFRELDETRGMVISDYQDELEKKWVTELRKKHNIELNKKVIKDVIKKLTN